MASLIKDLRDQLEAVGDWEEVSVLADRTLSYGTSAAQQRRVFDRRGRLADVVDHLLARTSGHLTVQPATDVFEAGVAHPGELWLDGGEDVFGIVAAASDASVELNLARVVPAA